MTLGQLEAHMDSTEYRLQMAYDDLATTNDAQRELEESAERKLKALKAKGHVIQNR